jgi:predicted transcriptional regulator
MELLERLEILREDMEELDVTTLAEVIKRIKELHQQLDGR